ncbi:MAG: dihydroorotase [Acidobacteria bacterium]|nr:dihydroorotase [Acidobacteriota bacterium]
MKRLLKGGRVVDPASGVDGRADVLIEDGRITRVEPNIATADSEVVDCSGRVVAPGFIDMHVHLREPGREDEETIASGSRAATAGGFTTVACMPNTEPPLDNGSIIEFVLTQARRAEGANVMPIGCVTKARKGAELAEIGEMVRAGAVAVSDDGSPVASPLLMRRALEYCRQFGIPVIDHCEDPDLAASGAMNEGQVSTALGLRGMPCAAEDIMVCRDIRLAEITGGRVHIAHVSAHRSVEAIREARARGVAVSGEATPHHFSLTEEAVRGFDTHAKMNPPLRSEEDRAGVMEGVLDGTLEAIATDHAPHNAIEKDVEFERAPFGIIGLEMAVSISLDRLVHGAGMKLAEMIRRFTEGPARILGLRGRGTLAPGSHADVTVLDPDCEVTVKMDALHSLSRNCPYSGWKLRGAPVMTLVGGVLVWRRD